MSRLSRKTRSFIAYSNFIKCWMFPVWASLGLSRLVVAGISFKTIAPHLGEMTGVAAWLPVVNSSQIFRARQIGQVLQVASRYTPWRSNCFSQAIVSTLLLRLYRVPYCLFFGVRRLGSNGEIDAHAWVATGSVSVSGRWSFAKYTVVGVFTNLRRD